MQLLIANLGSTSFKSKLFDMSSDTPRVPIASGAADRIGQGNSAWEVRVGERALEGTADLADHGAAIDAILAGINELGVDTSSGIAGVGFKAVHGGPISGAVVVDDGVLGTMEQFSDVAPAHNPPYIAAMRAIAEKWPDTPQVAAFETAFHQTIPLPRQVYGVPYEWTQAGVRRYGFHGASHRYIGERVGEVMPEAKRVISCHLGGSCSVCAIDAGKSVYHSMGMTPQTGLFHTNRVGDFDTFALLKLLPMHDGDLDKVFRRLGKEGGLLGISGVSADMRDVEEAAANGNERAQLALDAFVESVRTQVGACLMALGGVDAIVFTAGIGQFGKGVREGVCRDLAFAGVELDASLNDQATGRDEQRLDADGSAAAVWVLPTDEEWVVARQTQDVLQSQTANA
ncbi:MAG: acetate/propionate family kinase [Planctomycetota bacterium]